MKYREIMKQGDHETPLYTNLSCKGSRYFFYHLPSSRKLNPINCPLCKIDWTRTDGIIRKGIVDLFHLSKLIYPERGACIFSNIFFCITECKKKMQLDVEESTPASGTSLIDFTLELQLAIAIMLLLTNMFCF